MDKLPAYHEPRHRVERPRKANAAFKSLLAAVLLATVSLTYLSANLGSREPATKIPINADKIINQCKALNVIPGPPSNFHQRTESDRFEAGTLPVLIRNATLWTGANDGKEVIKGDLLLANGLIKAVGEVESVQLKAYADLLTVDANGAWVTPGIIDVHSHMS
ncbi:hypothetical protein CC2G_008734 [Coprinopsis cinerea AmutBmut pab1-1]|nr:hypothetical protein CC2G_008734 [Coprinopsis cinerea AmutBmut pab1-1]